MRANSAPGDNWLSTGLPVAAVCGGLVSLELSAAIAKGLFGSAGVFGVIVLRLCIGSVLLFAIRRPRFPSSPRARRLTAVAGLALILHHLTFYTAIDRVPLGVAVTLEFCGPLALSLVGRRNRLDLIPAIIAAAGVICVASNSASGHINALGLVCAVGAGAAWAGYLVAAHRLGKATEDGGWLAWSMLLAGVLSLPLLFAARSGIFHPHTLLLGVAVALLAEVLAYSLSNAALTKLDTRLFGTLSSLEPAIGALVGVAVLGQALTVLQWSGIALVTIASALAVGLAGRPPRFQRE